MIYRENFTNFEKKFTVYSLPLGFYIEVENDGEFIICHMCNEGYGIKMHMFTLLNKDVKSIEDVLGANVTKYMLLYNKQYGD